MGAGLGKNHKRRHKLTGESSKGSRLSARQPILMLVYLRVRR
jgi:hypothetical protein